MRAVRLAIVALIGMALAILPVAAGFAAAPMAQATTQVDMCTSAHEAGCPCCDMSQVRSTHVCSLKCCSAVAILAEPLAQTGPRSQAAADLVAAALSPFSAQPDPPPPRA